MNEPLDDLFKTISIVGEVLILPHNDPDPDAIASTAGGNGTMEGGRIALGNELPDKSAQQIRQRALNVLIFAPGSAGKPLIE